jgi:hypothetical protein
MAYRVDVGINTNRPVWRAYVNSWDAYQDEYNVKMVDGELVFESEAHFTWFMLRWGQ